MGKMLSDFWNNPAVARNSFHVALLAAGAIGAGCSQQLAALSSIHQGIILAVCSVAVILAGISAHTSGAQS